MLCYVILCYVLLCYVMCYVMLCYVMLCYVCMYVIVWCGAHGPAMCEWKMAAREPAGRKRAK